MSEGGGASKNVPLSLSEGSLDCFDRSKREAYCVSNSLLFVAIFP